MATKTRVTLEEFLAMPETEPPSELWDGEVIQKVAPSFNHGIITSYLIRELGVYLQQTGEGLVVNEVRHVERSEGKVYLPDINVVLASHRPRSADERRRGPIELVPDIAIEVLSPSDNAGRTLQRADFYMQSGVSLAWFVDPDLQIVTVYRPGAQPLTYRSPDVLDAVPVLRDFKLDLHALFGALDD